MYTLTHIHTTSTGRSTGTLFFNVQWEKRKWRRWGEQLDGEKSVFVCDKENERKDRTQSVEWEIRGKRREGSLLCCFAHGQTYTSRKGESTHVKGLKPEKDKGDCVHKSLLVRRWGGPQYVVPLYLCDQTAYLAFLRHQLFCWKSPLMFSCLRELIQPVVSFPTFPRACVHINMWLCIWYPGDKTQFS